MHRAALTCIAALMLWAGTPPAGAAERIGLAQARLVAETESATAPEVGATLYAQFSFELPPALEEAVQRGIALYFVVEFELFRNRWYWFDKKLVDETLHYRLSFSPLTRQYRLSRGTLAQPFDTLGDALTALRRVSGWRVINPGVLSTEDDPQDFRARVRMRLDTSQLPKPFQVTALAQSDWHLASDWHALSLPALLQPRP